LHDASLPDMWRHTKIWIKAEEACRKCDLLLVVGTSLEVMPSAKLPILALENDAALVIVNHTDTYVDVRANIIIRANVAEVFPLILEEVLND
jgi:NAD-dependent deacetylase